MSFEYKAENNQADIFVCIMYGIRLMKWASCYTMSPFATISIFYVGIKDKIDKTIQNTQALLPQFLGAIYLPIYR